MHPLHSFRCCLPLALAALAAAPFLAAPAAAAPHFVLVKDVYPGASAGATDYLSGTDDFLFFWGKDAGHTLGDPFGTDGTAANTGLIKDVMGSSGNFFTGHEKVQFGGKVYFWFDDGIHGEQLWTSDGSAAGTVVLSSLTGQASDGAGIYTVIVYAGRVWFTGRCPTTTNRCYYSTDGTPAGTHQELSPRFGDRLLVALDDSLFYRDNFAQLYVSDGTVAGSTALGTALGQPQYPTSVNGRLVYGSTDASAGAEPWVSDGTVAGTHRIADLNPGTANATPTLLTRVDDRVFFVALTPTSGRELWVTDGTAAGTVQVKDVRPGIQDSGIVLPAAVNGKLFFVADDGTHGFEPWISDGTDAGTVMLVDTAAGATSGAGTTRAVYSTGALVFFTAQSGSSSVLWSTDGTSAGTHPVDTRVFGASNTLTTSAGRLYMATSTTTPSTGAEVYALNLLDYDRPAAGRSRLCTSVELGIPDEGSLTSTLVLPAYAAIADVAVSVDAGHTYVGDLRIALTHQETAKTVLLAEESDCSGALIDVGFSDTGSTPTATACAGTRPAFPRDSVYRPAAPLSTFNGDPVQGHWKLTVTDTARQDVGTLHAWCMTFATDRIFSDVFE